MKEFVPGRDIRRNSQSVSEEDRSEELKIACLEGSICYLMAKEFSQIRPRIEMAAPRMLYRVFEELGDGAEQLALGEEEGVEKAHLLRNFASGRRVRFIVRDAYGQQKNSVFYNFEIEKSKREDFSLDDLKLRLVCDTYWSLNAVEEYIIEPLNNITLHSKDETEQVIFLLPAKNGYGFRVYQVRVSYGSGGETIYSIIQNDTDDHKYGVYYSFEQMASFFDGTR